MIDDDKDRKYKIRKNEDGEDELYIEGGDGEEEIGFEVPEFDTDDEEAAVMTPEQLAERERRREEAEQARLKNLEERICKAEKLIAEGDYEAAGYEVLNAEKLDEKNGEVGALKLRAFSCDFTDFTKTEELAEAAEIVREFADAEKRRQLNAYAQNVLPVLQSATDERDALEKQNEEKKNERREFFKKRASKSSVWFITSLAAFIVPLIIAIVFSTMMFAREDGVYLILTAVFAGIAVVTFISTLITAHRYWEDLRNVKLNERNSSTKLGRAFEQKKIEVERLTLIYAVVSGSSDGKADNDLS